MSGWVISVGAVMMVLGESGSSLMGVSRDEKVVLLRVADLVDAMSDIAG
jgi:hypothetical protein